MKELRTKSRTCFALGKLVYKQNTHTHNVIVCNTELYDVFYYNRILHI